MDDDEWELRWVRVPEGTHLSSSSDTPGVERDLLREDDTNRLLGPTESRAAHIDDLGSARSYNTDRDDDYDDDGLTPQQRQFAEQLGLALGAALIEILRQALPVAGTKLRKAWSRRPNRLRRSDRQSTPADPSTATQDTGSSTELDITAAEPRIRMTAAEYEEQLLLLHAAESFLAEQRRKLARAHIIGDEPPLELENASRFALEPYIPLPDEAAFMRAAEHGDLGDAEQGIEVAREGLRDGEGARMSADVSDHAKS